ncbi:MAG TPA: hypothetical protein VK469_17115 [Candidatus Kapabacteria bacterium]|nr:hypothetical protein [Candidatus Kapabacteria bacterium]
MKHQRTVTILVICIAIFAALAASIGILSNEGQGLSEYKTIRGEVIEIYGKGIYKHMTAEVAPQGIAQDYVTLFIGIPLLLIALFKTRKGSFVGRFLLCGTLGYFLVTYLFYLVMGMYNPLFLVYAFLMGTSFFAFSLTMLSFEVEKLPAYFRENTPVKFTGGFLVFNAFSIAFLWLSIVLPPLLDGTIYPKSLDHYTTLIVQGMDLGLLLPLAVISGILLLKKKAFGYLLGPVYLVFLSILMTALTAKVIGMALLGFNVIPVIFIIPTFNIITIICSILILRSISYKL